MLPMNTTGTFSRTGTIQTESNYQIRVHCGQEWEALRIEVQEKSKMFVVTSHDGGLQTSKVSPHWRDWHPPDDLNCTGVGIV